MKQNSMLAMILAGGRGSRLHDLTNKVAKPAVSYGGKYRIVDFPLSNCANSGIDVVGVLTQYESVELNSYVAAGRRWGLDSKDSGVYVLPPREKADTGLDVYRGTADAISQNIDFIDQYAPEYLLVLSGDHIYKMDYSEMLKAHIKNGAACTIAAIEVPISEASRFGVLNTNPDGSIYEFEEKPKQPKSNLASMGIYVFTAAKLFKYLEEDDKNPDSSKDFGKDVLPAMLKAGEKMYSYKFEGYWKDVGTIASLWQANMDLLDENPVFDVGGTDRKIHSRNPLAPPEYIGEEGVVKNSMIALGCEIEGCVEHSVLGSNVIVEKGAEVKDAVILANSVIKAGAKVSYSIIDENVTVGKNAVVGVDRNPKAEIVVLGRDLTVGDGVKVLSGQKHEKDILE